MMPTPSDKARRVIAEVHSIRMYGQPLDNLAPNLVDGCWDIADDIVERLAALQSSVAMNGHQQSEAT